MDNKVKLNFKRDLDLMFFLWKWKMAPSIVLFHHFFKEAGFRTGYNRLMRLEKGGFIKSVTIDRNHGWIWSLADKGFRCIRERLPKLEEVGYKSENIAHDLLVNSVHSGEWYKNPPEGCSWITEQELRRLSLGELPIWVPKSDLHRPDGYWLAPYKDGYRTLALEVELNFKDDLKYGSVGRFYENSEEVSAILWVVKTKPMGTKIHKALKDGIMGSHFCHSFVSLSDFLKSGWQAKIFLGQNAGFTMSQMIHSGSSHHGSPGGVMCMGHAWIDTRKKPINTALSKSFAIYHF